MNSPAKYQREIIPAIAVTPEMSNHGMNARYSPEATGVGSEAITPPSELAGKAAVGGAGVKIDSFEDLWNPKKMQEADEFAANNPQAAIEAAAIRHAPKLGEYADPVARHMAVRKAVAARGGNPNHWFNQP